MHKYIYVICYTTHPDITWGSLIKCISIYGSIHNMFQQIYLWNMHKYIYVICCTTHPNTTWGSFINMQQKSPMSYRDVF